MLLVPEFLQLRPAQAYDAFSYYYDNRKETAKDIIENETEPHGCRGLMMRIKLYSDGSIETLFSGCFLINLLPLTA